LDTKSSYILEQDECVFMVIDIQERLAAVMEERVRVTANCLHLLESAKLLGIQVILTEQYPKGLGRTIEEVRAALPEYSPIEKMTFDCCSERAFMDEIKASGRKTVIVSGMETHICVLQTVTGLLASGFNVHVVNDAVCSRDKRNYDTGIEFMRDAGAVITCTETVLFQLLKIAGTEEFKAISKRIK